MLQGCCVFPPSPPFLGEGQGVHFKGPTVTGNSPACFFSSKLKPLQQTRGHKLVSAYIICILNTQMLSVRCCCCALLKCAAAGWCTYQSLPQPHPTVSPAHLSLISWAQVRLVAPNDLARAAIEAHAKISRYTPGSYPHLTLPTKREV